MSLEFATEREPLPALAQLGELTMALLLDGPASELEREQLIMADAGEPLPWTHTRAYLHPTVESQVVDDVDAGERQVGIRNVAVTPAAHGAVP